MTDLSNQLQQCLAADYTLERELTGGGMSRVFLMRDRKLGRRVVVKVLPQELAEALLDRFRREIMLAASLQHPNIVAVFAAGDVDGLPYLIMPFVEGESLRQRLETAGPMPVREAVPIMRDLARALAHAHAQGIVHRDVKPDNVLLSGGAATLTDFGVAKALSTAGAPITRATGANTLTQIGTSLGTPGYMAPEQLAGEAGLDYRADLYAFGITAYEMLAGATPFHYDSLPRLLAAHLTETPRPLAESRKDIPLALARLIEQCLAKEPADRPASAAVVAAALEDPAVVSGPVPTVRVSRAGPRPGRISPAVIAAAAAATAAAIGIAIVRRPLPSTPTPGPASERSIAVLPFTTAGGDTANQYFADGMTDQLTAALGKVAGLQVASRTAAYAHRGSTRSATELGRALNVGSLLEGTVQRGGSRLRVTTQLVNARDGLSIWSDTYEREITDVFAVQDTIASAIVRSLSDRLGARLGPPPPPARRRGTRDLAAYDMYLRGQFHFQRRGDSSLRRAAEYFRQAARRDPNYAEAHTGLADALGLLPLYGGTRVDSVLPPALDAVDRAIARDSMLAAAYASRATLMGYARRWSEAERDYRKAIVLDSGYGSAHQWYGENLLIQGRVGEAVQELDRAAKLEPLSAVTAVSYGLALGVAGRGREAEAQARRAVDLDPGPGVTRFLLAAVLLYNGRADQAIPQLERANREVPGIVAGQGLLGYAYARAGRKAEAQTTLASINPRGSGSAGAIARIYLGLGERDSAMAWLERAAENRDQMFNSESLASPIFAPLRGDPRFDLLLRRLNLDPGMVGGRR